MNNIKKATKGYYLGVLGQLQPRHGAAEPLLRPTDSELGTGAAARQGGRSRGLGNTVCTPTQLTHGRNRLSYYLCNFLLLFLYFFGGLECACHTFGMVMSLNHDDFLREHST
jgi:hypothetical protein